MLFLCVYFCLKSCVYMVFMLYCHFFSELFLMNKKGVFYMKKYFYMNRDKSFSEVDLVSNGTHKRVVKFADKTVKSVHPVGVAWGNLYPRLFFMEKKPENVFFFGGRVLVQTDHGLNPAAVPSVESYKFQPFLRDVIDSVHAHENVLLTGGTGVGKTTHILQMAARINQPVLRINFNGETRMSDLLGKIMVVGGETKWIDGILPMAMRHGYWLLLDEIDFADPAVLSLLHPVLEDNPMLVLKENAGEIIHPHDNFRVFATANSIGAMSSRSSSYSGTNDMNEAFIDRWQVVFVDNLPEKDELKVVREKVPGLPLAFAKKIVMFANNVRSGKAGDEFVFKGDNFSTRKVLSWAKKAALHRNIITGAKLSWLDKMDQANQEVISRILGTYFGNGKRQKRVDHMGKVVSMKKPRARTKKMVMKKLAA